MKFHVAWCDIENYGTYSEIVEADSPEAAARLKMDCTHPKVTIVVTPVAQRFKFKVIPAIEAKLEQLFDDL